jgi:hypothetical protein
MADQGRIDGRTQLIGINCNPDWTLFITGDAIIRHFVN